MRMGWSFWKDVIESFAHIAVIAGIVVAFIEYYDQKDVERKRIAIDETASTVTPHFLQAVRTLGNVIDRSTRSDIPDVEVEQSLYLVMNTYFRLHDLFKYDLADRCIIKDSIYETARHLRPLVDRVANTQTTRLYKIKDQYSQLLDDMAAQDCQ